jgi:hypothetical protein
MALTAAVTFCLSAGFVSTSAAAAELSRTDVSVGDYDNANSAPRMQAGSWQLLQLWNLRCLSTGVLNEVVTVSCRSGDNFQRWTGESGTGIIRNIQTGKCLDSNARGQAYMLSCNGGRYQDWNDISHYRVQNAAIGLCLAVGNGQGNSVFTQQCDQGSAYQGWDYR